MAKEKPPYVQFTKEMKKDYVIFAPNMLPIQLKLILQVLVNYGYNVKLLETEGQKIVDTGLKYVHNDTCYPAIMVIGQFVDAVINGGYDPHKVALIMFQTGGGCRASNYISLLRKALEKAGYGYVPVISFSFASLEHHPGFKLTLPIVHKMIYGLIYGDIIFSLVNQCKPYELHKGDTQKLADEITTELVGKMLSDGVSMKKTIKNCREIVERFSEIEVSNDEKVKVGIVGEIFVKFSPLANNNLEQFLVDQGAEAVIPGLLGFFQYCIYNTLIDYRFYRKGKKLYPIMKFVYKYVNKKQRQISEIMEENGRFNGFPSFERTVSLVDGYMSHGCKMGEGWLLPAEMLELMDMGVKNIVCAQPFGCLPNHICGKGMMKPIKDNNPDVNIVAVDYDASATKVNQENRIKLMLSNARENMTNNKKESNFSKFDPEKQTVNV